MQTFLWKFSNLIQKQFVALWLVSLIQKCFSLALPTIARSDTITLVGQDTKALVVALLRRPRHGGVITREVDISRDITIPSNDGNLVSFTLCAAVQHVDHLFTGNSGHFFCHILYENIFYKSDSDKPIIPSKLSDVKKSTHFLYRLVSNTDNITGFT